MDAVQTRALYEKLKNRPGLRGKIDAKCLDCIYDGQAPGTWRQQVDACSVTDCALYTIRPKTYTGEQGEDEFIQMT